LFAFYSNLTDSHKAKLEFFLSFQNAFTFLFLLGLHRDKVLTCNRGIYEKRRPTRPRLCLEKKRQKKSEKVCDEQKHLALQCVGLLKLVSKCITF